MRNGSTFHRIDNRLKLLVYYHLRQKEANSGAQNFQDTQLDPHLFQDLDKLIWDYLIKIDSKVAADDFAEKSGIIVPHAGSKLGSAEDALMEELASLRLRVKSQEQVLRSSQQLSHQSEKRAKVITEFLIYVSKAERKEARAKVQQISLRLGDARMIGSGTGFSEAWVDGPAWKDLTSRYEKLIDNKKATEQHLRKKRHHDGTVTETGVQVEDSLIQDEIIRNRLAKIEREEQEVLEERHRYQLEKACLVREMKRIRDEDLSPFNGNPILNKRYALLNLLGKGGSSEVYKAYDLMEDKYVACKLHCLNAQWDEEKKRSYLIHANRENSILTSLEHRHIVQLFDNFVINDNTFCIDLEFCSGKDLDLVLKETPILSEREAKLVIVQIFQGLVYLNRRREKIIHYDLKPGNILFDEAGQVKVTDFGLSKIMEVESEQMELTSQGAGTYWYLPPECFEVDKIPLISSKVDVWSAGVIFYQMLFGKRPFGHDQTQLRILQENTILKASQVEFPSRPAVSKEAKDLISKCLTYNQSERPDVLSISQHPYLSYISKST